MLVRRVAGSMFMTVTFRVGRRSLLVRRVAGSMFVTVTFRVGRRSLLVRRVAGGVLVVAMTAGVVFTASAQQQTSSEHCEEKDFFHVSMIEK